MQPANCSRGWVKGRTKAILFEAGVVFVRSVRTPGLATQSGQAILLRMGQDTGSLGPMWFVLRGDPAEVHQVP